MKKSISKLQFLTRELPGYTHCKLAELACLGGFDWIQLRVKGKSFEEWLDIARETKKICEAYGARLIVNDNVSIAKEVKADGVHLGMNDMPPEKARVILGKEVVIGATANTFSDVTKHYQAGVDYIGLGPYKNTQTKDTLSPILGTSGVSDVLVKMRSKKISTPVIVVGGINLEDIGIVLRSGAHGMALASSLGHGDELPNNAKRFREQMDLYSMAFKTELG
jgi:thiamine-phosphate pyrophosphorylase